MIEVGWRKWGLGRVVGDLTWWSTGLENAAPWQKVSEWLYLRWS